LPNRQQAELVLAMKSFIAVATTAQLPCVAPFGVTRVNFSDSL
jgi:hypothetical protein